VTREFELKHQTMVPTVFHRNGKPIKKFNAAWNKAFSVAGVERRLFHDLRRTAAKNYVDSGTPKTTVMAITGHLTPKIFERYNIRDDDADKQKAAQAISRKVAVPGNGAVMGNGELRASV
jgi:integrase